MVQSTVWHVDLCVPVVLQVLLDAEAVLGEGGARRRCRRADVGVLLLDGRRAHHWLAVAPLEVARALRGTLVHRQVRPPQVRGAGESQDVAPCWACGEVLLEHAAVVSGRLATGQPALLQVAQPWPQASTWECLAL